LDIYVQIFFLGYETARTLAYFGATVILACRNLEAANKCVKVILEERPSAKLEVMHLNLASLKSVRMFAEEYRSKKWYAGKKRQVYRN
jgi:WW domain-containing oxidoreductase